MGTTTRFGTVTPLVQLRFEARGREVPVGYAVMKLAAVVFVTVTFSTTAVAPLTGTPPAPVIWTERLPPGPRCEPAFGWPLPERVSVMRAGLTGTNWPSVPAPLS